MSEFQVIHKRHKKPIRNPVRMTIKLRLQEAALIAKMARMAGVDEEAAVVRVLEDRLKGEPQPSEDEKEQYWLARLANRQQT